MRVRLIQQQRGAPPGPFLRFGTHATVPAACVDMHRLRAELTIENKSIVKQQAMRGGNADPRTRLWTEAGGYVTVPRGYSIPFLPGLRPRYTHFDRTREVVTGPWRFTRKLRDAQRAPAAALRRQAGDKLLCLGCGKGKTTLALEYAAERGLRTLVIVDRDFLLTQWTKEIEACGITDAASVGRVQGPKFRVGERITLAMVHTLAQKDFGEDFYDQFGLIIVDEAHVMAAPTFGTVIPRFRGERLVLTATPERVDGMHPVFMLHAGGLKPCYTDLSRDQSAAWVFAELPPLLSEREMERCQRRVYGRYRYRWDPAARASVREPMTMLNRAVYDTKAATSDAFNRIILAEIARSLEAGRHSLVLGSRVEQLELLAAACVEAGVDASVVTSHVKGKKRDAAFTKQVLFVTSSIGNKALDVPRLDTLYMLFPNDDPGFVRQAVGRIDRALGEKRTPVVVVFSHAAVPSLRKKAAAMMELVRSIDPKAEVRRVRRC